MATRELHTGWARHREWPDTYLVYAECDDEQTQMIIVNPDETLRRTWLVDESEAAQSEAYQRLVVDHQERCTACQEWARG